jgi:hypothetical protein
MTRAERRFLASRQGQRAAQREKLARYDFVLDLTLDDLDPEEALAEREFHERISQDPNFELEKDAGGVKVWRRVA